jgi:SAM-dependent methyltransferase
MKRSCPVCNSVRSRLLFSQSFEQLSGVNLLTGYDIVVCQDCGAAFADHIPPQAVFDEYYRDLSKYEHEFRAGQVSEYDEDRFRHTAKSVIEHVPSRQCRIMEIGCATGRLLALLRESGYENVVGVDPSPGCARAAWELYGVPVQTRTIFDIEPPEPPCDVLILVGVMEHVRDLDTAVAKLRSLLAPSGIAYLAVPDAAHFALQKDGPFQEFSHEHVNFFSLTSLTNLMELRGFRFLAGGRFFLEHSRHTWCSSIYGAFANDGPGRTSFVRDEETEKGLLEYIRKSEEVDNGVTRALERVAAAGRPILVWGTGAHTEKLLAAGSFDKVSIAAFVDSNPKYQGRHLRGIPILSPERLRHRKEPILISSYAAQHEIAQQIREQLGLENELILLYDL